MRERERARARAERERNERAEIGARGTLRGTKEEREKGEAYEIGLKRMWPGPRRLFIIENDKSNRFSAMRSAARLARVDVRRDRAAAWGRRGGGGGKR